jgi:hypothetical protein
MRRNEAGAADANNKKRPLNVMQLITTIQGWGKANDTRRAKQKADLRGLDLAVFRCDCIRHACGSGAVIEHEGTVYCNSCGAPRPTLKAAGHVFWCKSAKPISNLRSQMSEVTI